VCLRFDDTLGSVLQDPLQGAFFGDAPGNLTAPETGEIIDFSAATPAPEPATLALLGTALIGTSVLRRRKKQS
jgi:hypothetical protein